MRFILKWMKKIPLEYFQYLYTGFLPLLIKITLVRNQSTISFVVNWEIMEKLSNSALQEAHFVDFIYSPLQYNVII